VARAAWPARWSRTGAVRAASATPGAEASAPGALAAMLARLPANPPRLESPETARLYYADVAAQLAAVGIAAPDATNAAGVDRWLQAVYWLALPPSLSRWTHPNVGWRDLFGFDPYQVDQSCAIEAAPFGLTLLRGRFDPAELRAAWARSGYAPLDVDGTTIASLGDEVDLGSPSFRLAFGAMNHAAVLADGTVVFTRWEETMRAVLAVERGRAAAATSRVDVAALLPNLWPDLASAVLVSGQELVGEPLDIAALLGTPNPDPDALATQMASAEADFRRMPPIATALLGSTTGGPLGPVRVNGTPEPPAPGIPTARMVVALVTGSSPAAQTAASVVEERLATGATQDGQSYAALFPEHTVHAVAGEPIVLVELVLGPEARPDVLLRLLGNRDLDLFSWLP
jgi:hypothetical protein